MSEEMELHQREVETVRLLLVEETVRLLLVEEMVKNRQ